MMWTDVKDKDVVLPSMSKVILVTDGQRPQLVTVEKFLETVDTPYNTWTHWMKIPKIEDELISEKELNKLGFHSLTDDIESGLMKKDLGSFYPHDEQSWIQGYSIGFCKGYRKAKEE